MSGAGARDGRPPVLAVFVDGLGFEGLAGMPFVSGLTAKRRVETELGYSITCHASMYTGVRPDRHHVWFQWQRSPLTSPYRWLRRVPGLSLIDSLPTRMVAGRLSRIATHNTSYSGLPTMRRSVLRDWPEFDMSEHKLWDERGYLESAPTVFDLMRDSGVRWRSVGLLDARHDGGSLRHIEGFDASGEPAALTYLFIGELDHASHEWTNEDPRTVALLGRIDTQVERVYRALAAAAGADPVLVLWSDHGHVAVQERVDLYRHWEDNGERLPDFLHVIDTNFARFWFRDPGDEDTIRRVMATCPGGWFLSDEELARYRVTMPDDRYGDLVFYLDRPYMFAGTAWGYGLHTKSIHGYLPDYPEKDGVFVSTLPVTRQDKLKLVDVMPSLLELLDVPVPEGLDGASVW